MSTTTVTPTNTCASFMHMVSAAIVAKQMRVPVLVCQPVLIQGGLNSVNTVDCSSIMDPRPLTAAAAEPMMAVEVVLLKLLAQWARILLVVSW